MDILFLGYNRKQTSIIHFLEERGHNVVQISDKTTPTYFSKFGWVISFGYRHIITQKQIDAIKGNIINLHISYLPFNRGSHPNFWAFYDNTPSGVTIHKLDKGLDTGDILVRKQINFDITQETFLTTYNKLINEIEELFKENHIGIFNNTISPTPQINLKKGTYHKVKDLPPIKSWDINIKNYLEMVKRTDKEIIDEIEAIRTRNNVNWMDAVRLAFELAPERARAIFQDIKECDIKVNELLEELSTNE